MKSKTKQSPSVQFSDRQKCNCVAQRHPLIANCLNCGNIICARQGEGPCLHCGKLVVAADSSSYGGINSEELFPALSQQERQKISQERSKAILHRDRLVQRDKATQQSMSQNIVDEQVDYYEVSENQWIDNQHRKEAVKKLLQKHQQTNNKILSHMEYDTLTGKFVVVEATFDEQSFKKSGQQLMSQALQSEVAAKQDGVSGKPLWDMRVLKNDKMRDVCASLIGGRDPKTDKVRPTMARIDHITTQVVIDDELKKDLLS